jgi:protein-S-isoprenylcysteine O-methyltransferase Ste14
MTISTENTGPRPNGILGIAALAYAALAFVLTFGFFACFVIFLGNLPKPGAPWISPTVDTGATMPPLFAALCDLGLVALFGLQHSIIARPAFKAWWTRFIAEGLERSTYVLAASSAGFIMLVFWQPIPLLIWEVSGPLADIFWALFALGWLMLLLSAINFGILELLGLTQVWAWSRGRPPPPPTLKDRGLYRLMPHPMYVGVLLGFWMTPVMTAGHALIAAGLTGYILIAMRYEERDLRRTFGGAYRRRRQARQAVPPRS